MFDWSVYHQGTGEQGGDSSDAFIVAALDFYGDSDVARSTASPWNEGARIALQRCANWLVRDLALTALEYRRLNFRDPSAGLGLCVKRRRLPDTMASYFLLAGFFRAF